MAKSATAITNRKSRRQMGWGSHQSYSSKSLGNTVQQPINGLPPGTRTRLAGVRAEQR